MEGPGSFSSCVGASWLLQIAASEAVPLGNRCIGDQSLSQGLVFRRKNQPPPPVRAAPYSTRTPPTPLPKTLKKSAKAPSVFFHELPLWFTAGQMSQVDILVNG